MTQHFLINAKAYAALVGAIATGLLGVYAADTTVGQILTVVTIITTAVVTWRVPNQSLDIGPSQPILGKAIASTFSQAAEDERRRHLGH